MHEANLALVPSQIVEGTVPRPPFQIVFHGLESQVRDRTKKKKKEKKKKQEEHNKQKTENGKTGGVLGHSCAPTQWESGVQFFQFAKEFRVHTVASPSQEVEEVAPTEIGSPVTSQNRLNEHAVAVPALSRPGICHDRVFRHRVVRVWGT